MGLLRAFRRFLDIDHHDPHAVQLYGTVVEQARLPVFYTDLKVPDSVDGRFDMIVLHIFLVLSRFPQSERQHKVLRYLLEELFADMDNSLREIGVGDLSLPKKIHKMVDALYGRLEAYEDAITTDDPGITFEPVLRRNLYRKEANEAEIDPMVRYVLAAREHLQRQDVARILDGTVSFPKPSDCLKGK